MPDYDDTNRGAIWRNTKKDTEKHPDFTGHINIEGVEYWLSGWQKKPGDAERAPVVRFQVKRKEEKPQVATDNTAAGDDGFDDIPF